MVIMPVRKRNQKGCFLLGINITLQEVHADWHLYFLMQKLSAEGKLLLMQWPGNNLPVFKTDPAATKELETLVSIHTGRDVQFRTGRL